MDPDLEPGRRVDDRLTDAEWQTRTELRSEIADKINWPYYDEKYSHHGYPKLSRFMSHLNGQAIYRRFAYLSTRVLVHMQDELQTLELKLQDFDLAQKIANPETMRSRKVSEAESPERSELMEAIKLKWTDYGECLLMATELGNLERPAERDLVCLRNFMHGGSNRGQIISEEIWMYSESDLVTLFPPRNVALATAFQWLINFFGFMTNREIVLLHPMILRVSANVCMVVMILGLLAGPMYLMQMLAHPDFDPAQTGGLMGILVLCTGLFVGVLKACTSAKDHEIFMACVGYVAILVVFMSQN
ncbi:hypothetical protein S40293_06665 [Stachybotrys chartarum IBT 40293]|nr:hypothetical protein S40293_06665 [Stachybotrys chartarum IBT 40293]